MAKWKKQDPTEAEANKVVADLLPTLRTQRDELLASWHGSVPNDYESALIRSIIRPPLVERFGTGYSPVKSMVDALLANELITPLRAAFRRQQAEVEKAATALVDTNRPVAAVRVSSSKERIGSFAIVTDRGDSMHEKDRVLVCIDCGYVPDDGEHEYGGWYCNFAEPNDAEKQMAEYTQLMAKVEADRTYEQRHRQIIADRRQQELDAIRAEGREPTLFEDLFAGTSDN